MKKLFNHYKMIATYSFVSLFIINTKNYFAIKLNEPYKKVKNNDDIIRYGLLKICILSVISPILFFCYFLHTLQVVEFINYISIKNIICIPFKCAFNDEHIVNKEKLYQLIDKTTTYNFKYKCGFFIDLQTMSFDNFMKSNNFIVLQNKRIHVVNR